MFLRKQHLAIYIEKIFLNIQNLVSIFTAEKKINKRPL